MNFKTLGKPVSGGYLHPLLKVILLLSFVMTSHVMLLTSHVATGCGNINRSALSLERFCSPWASVRCQPTSSLKAVSGTLIRCFNLKATQRVTLTTPSSYQNQQQRCQCLRTIWPGLRRLVHVCVCVSVWGVSMIYIYI
jgi:hypothetical protein